MYGMLDISTSGMIAQRTRLTIASANLAQQNSILNERGEYEPYQRRFALLAAEEHGGVRIAAVMKDESPGLARFEPDSPYADGDGYVMYPNIDPVIEQMNAMEAMRSYEANISAAETTKAMMTAALRMLA